MYSYVVESFYIEQASIKVYDQAKEAIAVGIRGAQIGLSIQQLASLFYYPGHILVLLRQCLVYFRTY